MSDDICSNMIRLHYPDGLENTNSFKAVKDLMAPALYHASYFGLLGPARLILESGSDVNAKGGHQFTALQAAAAGGHEQIVQLLLAMGADVNLQGGTCGTALNAAAYNAHKEVVRLLVAAGTDINIQTGGTGNGLHAAAIGGCEETVQLLIANGAEVNTPCRS